MECFIYASVAGGELLMMDNALLLPAESSCVFRSRRFSSHKGGLFSYVIISISMDNIRVLGYRTICFKPLLSETMANSGRQSP